MLFCHLEDTSSGEYCWNSKVSDGHDGACIQDAATPLGAKTEFLRPTCVLRGIKRIIPWAWRHWLSKNRMEMQRALLPLRRRNDFGDLRRLTPIDRNFGWSRGQPIDRHYIEQFLKLHAQDVYGDVLEFQSNVYTYQFGNGRVTHSHVLDCSSDNRRATIIADIAQAEEIASDTYDCVLCTQVLCLIYDLRGAVSNLHRILKPGGVVLATAPGIAHKLVNERGAEDNWRLTSNSARRLFGEIFQPEKVEVKTYGNVLAATAFLYGLAAQELSIQELEYNDPEQQITVAVRAMK